MSEKFTVESFFVEKSNVVRAIYAKLLAETRKFGPVSEEPKKTSIHLVNKSAFAGVSTRQMALMLNVKSATPIVSPRFPRHEKVSANRYHQEVKLSNPSEVDSELLGWLKQAYELSA
jgi:hypothetical protein